MSEAIAIVILGSICGLRNISQIHQWAASRKNSEFLKEKFGINRIPCYYWLLSLMKLVKPESLNRCFIKWVESLLPENTAKGTISLDGKTIRSTKGKTGYESPLHIVSAHLSEMGLTFAQKSVNGKSNEIPAVQDLLSDLNIKGCLIVADALNCQKATAEVIIKGKGDYLLCVKKNHKSMFEDIETYIQDDELRLGMEKAVSLEKSRERIERRTAYITKDISWLYERNAWRGIKAIGAIRTEFTTAKGKSDEWHYYITSRELSAKDLLHHARMEWSVESMHWLLDVHYSEDFCRVEDKNIQQNLNMLRKCALNLIKAYKAKCSSKLALSKIMFNCLLENEWILDVISKN